MTAIRLDESHCPAGLERSIYDMAFKFRSDRHEMERSLGEALKQIEVKKEEVKEAQKKIKYHENVYNKENETLLEFRVSLLQQILISIYVFFRVNIYQIV